MRNPRISVIIPSYNHRLYIQEAIDSVLSQTLRDLELIIIDDGSQDSSLELLDSITDERVQVIAQENRGAHATINRGLRMARAPYLTILNSDDRYTPDRLEILMAVADAHPEYALLGSYINVIDQDGQVLGVKEGYHTLDPWPVPDAARTFKADGDLRTALLLQNYWATTSNFIFPQSIYDACGPFHNLRYAHDWDFALRTQLEHSAYLHGVPLMDYRIHASNTIRDNRAAMIFEICWILAYHLPQYTRQSTFWDTGVERRAEQLQHSIYMYGCDAVFWQMMILIQNSLDDVALSLLEPENPVRKHYVATIQSLIEEPLAAAVCIDHSAPKHSSLVARVRSFLSFLYHERSN